MPVDHALRVRAFAKVNLGLRVLGARPDGYHELRTILQSLALHDTLILRRTPGAFRIECDDSSCPKDATNLVWRAAERLWREARRRGAPRGVTVRIVKRIPIQAGLGGGSSDAAAAILGLARLWDIDLPHERRRVLAADLGSDVAFFFEGGTSLALGRGDELFPLMDVPSAWVTLAVPDFGVSTVAAYRWWDESLRQRGVDGKRVKPCSEWVRSTHWPAADLRNDLEVPVSRHHPEIAATIRTLARLGALLSGMSGSGSAVFGLFDRRQRAERAARALAGRVRRAMVTRTIDRATYRRLARSRPASRLA
jgi:4-diphosphocytidyl-2-C-methyl-D-erythritol kinase